MTFIFFTLVSYIFYLFFTAGSGDLLLWSLDELIAGGFISIIISALFVKIFPVKVSLKYFNPLFWVLMIIYTFGPFLYSLALSNFEVVYRVITGKFNPSIVRVDTDIKSGVGAFVLANSITLTPGTLTMGVEDGTNAVYVHNLEWKKGRGERATASDVSGPLHFWVKKMFG